METFHCEFESRPRQVIISPLFDIDNDDADEQGAKMLDNFMAKYSVSSTPSPIAVCYSDICLPHKIQQCETGSRPFLILDMDETLLHASIAPIIGDPNTIFHLYGIKYFVYLRPHMFEFLEHVSRDWEVCVFTAGVREYANKILDFIDPCGKLIHHRLFREHCTPVGNAYVKDLSRINRHTLRTVIIDNCPDSYLFHPDNALPIRTWLSDPEDTELLKLIPVLDALAKVDNVTKSIRIRTSS